MSLSPRDTDAPPPASHTPSAPTTPRTRMSAKDKDEDRDELSDDDAAFDEDEDGGDPNVFKIRGSLEQPDAQAITTERLHWLMHQAHIDLQPAYQRDVVWSKAKQMEMIHSIYHNFYVPPVIFAVTVDDDGEETRVCVDGKQRLTSILLFIDGQIPYQDPATRKLWYFTAPDGKKALIPEHGRKLFAEKVLTCVEYRHLSMSAERDVFQRVQMGMPLKTAEKWQAISSAWADWINRIEMQYIGVDGGLAQAIPIDTRRGNGFYNLAALAYCLDCLPAQVVPVGKSVEKWLATGNGPAHAFERAFVQILQRLLEMAPDPDVNEVFKVSAKVSPVEFVYMGACVRPRLRASDADGGCG
ncbi:hypothetical protein FA95DRAFT_1554754 [Auriscalpium vulgare]|uniref:Uncharacterized protein n=1 Tax=Auriscalpium vulgare TaxID=40419 RepID=A0ACB8S4Z9_9AGAM|nr:hypothetical protein FA95DRAFT_1554754 [Auriscalpium vulgare]